MSTKSKSWDAAGISHCYTNRSSLRGEAVGTAMAMAGGRPEGAIDEGDMPWTDRGERCLLFRLLLNILLYIYVSIASGFLSLYLKFSPERSSVRYWIFSQIDRIFLQYANCCSRSEDLGPIAAY